MAKTNGGNTSTHRFFGWVRAPEAAPPLDPADQGTAFGLELSLGEPDDTLFSQPPQEDDPPREPPRF